MPRTSQKSEFMPVNDTELMKFNLDRIRLKALSKEADALKKDVEAREADLIARVEGGAVIRSALFVVAVDRTKTRRNVSWKDELLSFFKSIGKNPEVEEQRILDATPVVVYPKITLMEKNG